MPYPCPMCLGALYCCSPDTVFFLTQRERYEECYTDSREHFEFGAFDDEYEKDWQDRNLPLVHAEETDHDTLSVDERRQDETSRSAYRSSRPNSSSTPTESATPAPKA